MKMVSRKHFIISAAAGGLLNPLLPAAGWPVQHCLCVTALYSLSHPCRDVVVRGQHSHRKSGHMVALVKGICINILIQSMSMFSTCTLAGEYPPRAPPKTPQSTVSAICNTFAIRQYCARLLMHINDSSNLTSVRGGGQTQWKSYVGIFSGVNVVHDDDITESVSQK